VKSILAQILDAFCDFTIKLKLVHGDLNLDNVFVMSPMVNSGAKVEKTSG